MGDAIQCLRKEHLGTGDGDEGGEEGDGLPPVEGLPRGTGLKYFHEGGGYFPGQERNFLTKGRNIFMRRCCCWFLKVKQMRRSYFSFQRRRERE